MGTTLTAALLADGRLDVVHVGDSRAYLWRDGELRQLTEDHSVVAELVRRGSLSAEDAEHHPHRNVITRALGAEPDVVADTVSEALRDGDVVLLCSDGLSSYVPERDIAAVLAEAGSLREAAAALVERANAAGGTDNVTVVLARAGRAPAEGGGGTAESTVPEAEEAGPADRRDAGAGRRARACRHGARRPRRPPSAGARAGPPPALAGAGRPGGSDRGAGGRGRHPRLGREPQLPPPGGARRHRARDARVAGVGGGPRPGDAVAGHRRPGRRRARRAARRLLVVVDPGPGRRRAAGRRPGVALRPGRRPGHRASARAPSRAPPRPRRPRPTPVP